MAQKPKTLQDIFRERRMQDMKREYRREQIGRFFILMRRLALVGALIYGGVWAKKNPEAAKSFCSAPIEYLSNFSLFKDFKEGAEIVKDTLKPQTPEQIKANEAYHTHRKKVIAGYKTDGLNVVIKSAAPGTEEYKKELEGYRKEGLFDAGR